MKPPRLLHRCAFLFALCLSPLGLAATELPEPLPKDARIAVVGDSITAQRLYSKFIETYLLTAGGRPDVEVFQFGQGGETAGGFNRRLENDLATFQPNVVTLCYGMNDGGAKPYDAAIGQQYESAMRSILEKLTQRKARILVGTPGAADSKYFSRPFPPNINPAESYNQNLSRLGEHGRKLAEEFHTGFTDVHAPMIETMRKAKAAYGEDYDVCGKDGVHPSPNGHLIMAYAFLKGLGCDGNVGKIVVDAAGKANASPGHTVLSSTPGRVELESERYPFCFEAAPPSSRGTRSILPHLPFNQELNRLTLQVKQLPSARARVTWGDQAREFTREQLEAGVNLAAEFETTPFDKPFFALMECVAEKQALEALIIQGLLSNLRNYQKTLEKDPELASSVNTLRTQLAAARTRLHAQTLDKRIPVKHSITITPL